MGGSASLPADHGLSGLGLVMQLVGTVMTAIVTSYGVLTLIIMMQSSRGMGGGPGGKETMFLLLLIASSVLRSLAHRAAGTRLLYDGPGTPASAIKRYLGASGIQIAVVCGFMLMENAPGKMVGVLFLILAAWPIALSILALPNLQRFESVPMAEDKGFEGAAILMLILGSIGLAASIILLLTWTEYPSEVKTELIGIGMLVTYIMLTIRSAFHVRAGFRGVAETHLDRAVEAAGKYADFGVIAAFVAGGAILLGFMGLPGSPGGIGMIVMMMMVVMISWSLLAWPLIVRRFFSERQFADLLAGGEAPQHRRSPDHGLATLGWLLVALGAFYLAVNLAGVIMEDFGGGGRRRGMGGDPMSELFAMMGNASDKSPWWQVGSSALQLWAGIELCRMTDRHKIVGTIYGVGAAVVALYINLPMLEGLMKGGFEMAMNPLAGAGLGGVAIQLVIPVATLILVNRKARGDGRTRMPRPNP
jgi:hypothetical protein